MNLCQLKGLCQLLGVDVVSSAPPDTVPIHQGGKAAAETILDMRTTGDFSQASCREYARRWNAAFGYDFNNVSPLLFQCILMLPAALEIA